LVDTLNKRRPCKPEPRTATQALVNPEELELIIGFAPTTHNAHLILQAAYTEVSPKLTAAWSLFPTVPQLIEYFEFSLRLYSHCVYNERYARASLATDSYGKLKATPGEDFEIPVFMLDLIREMCRPLYAGHLTMLPYFPLIHQGIGSVPGLGFTNRFRSYSNALRTVFDMSSIFEEAPGYAPFFVANETTIVWSNGVNVPDYRKLSMSMLKYVDRTIEIYTSYASKNQRPGIDNPFDLTPFSQHVFVPIAHVPINQLPLLSVNTDVLSQNLFHMATHLADPRLAPALPIALQLPAAAAPAYNFAGKPIEPILAQILWVLSATDNDFANAHVNRGRFAVNATAFTLPSVHFTQLRYAPRFPNAVTPSLIGSKVIAIPPASRPSPRHRPRKGKQKDKDADPAPTPPSESKK